MSRSFTCRYFGHRVDVAVWCGKPGEGYVRSQAERGCAFWMREPGADDDLRAPEPPSEASGLSDTVNQESQLAFREVALPPALIRPRGR